MGVIGLPVSWFRYLLPVCEGGHVWKLMFADGLNGEGFYLGSDFCVIAVVTLILSLRQLRNIDEQCHLGTVLILNLI